MNSQTINSYENYEQALASHDFFVAIEMLKQYVSQNPHAAMEWYWLGYALMRVHLHAQAGLYLRRSLRELDNQTPSATQNAETYVTKASIYALLQEKDICIQHLHTALWINPTLLEDLPHDITLQGILQPQDWENIYTTLRIRNCQDYLTKHGWEIPAKNADKSMTLQAIYKENVYWHLQLDYELIEHQGIILLQDTQDRENKHIYHFRAHKNSFEWLGILVHCPHTITDKQWSELSEALIEVCETVTWEVPDGRRIKIG